MFLSIDTIKYFVFTTSVSVLFNVFLYLATCAVCLLVSNEFTSQFINTKTALYPCLYNYIKKKLQQQQLYNQKKPIVCRTKIRVCGL